ncbi:MAG: PaeR7I family type II restriction endonuclease [Bacillota bacterium]
MNDRVKDAAALYWAVRTHQQSKQSEAGKSDAGLRGAVTGGAQMNGFVDLVREVIIGCGIPSKCIFEKTHVELPGYYRPEKKWDLLVVHKGVLGAAIELKSQCGPSFGNNFNNRVEEAIGSATDLWTAYREGRLGCAIKPWLGYLFLLEDCPESSTPVSVREPHFKVDEVFRGASYKRRYAVFCRRLVLERLYDASCFLTAGFSNDTVTVSAPDPALSYELFIASLRGQMAALLAL